MWVSVYQYHKIDTPFTSTVVKAPTVGSTLQSKLCTKEKEKGEIRKERMKRRVRKALLQQQRLKRKVYSVVVNLPWLMGNRPWVWGGRDEDAEIFTGTEGSRSEGQLRPNLKIKSESGVLECSDVNSEERWWRYWTKDIRDGAARQEGTKKNPEMTVGWKEHWWVYSNYCGKKLGEMNQHSSIGFLTDWSTPRSV